MTRGTLRLGDGRALHVHIEPHDDTGRHRYMAALRDAGGLTFGETGVAPTLAEAWAAVLAVVERELAKAVAP